MIFIVIACFVVLPLVRAAPANATTEEGVRRNANSTSDTDSNLSSTEKIYSDIIKVSEKDNQKYDTISYSTQQHQPRQLHQREPMKDSKPSRTDSKIFILDNGRTYQVGHQDYQSGNPYLSAAIGTVSAHLVSQAHEEYIPYPPNGNPNEYPAYRGQEISESPLAGAYDRANRAGYGFYPTQREYPNHGAFFNQYQHSCYPSFYHGDSDGHLEFEDRFRARKEPIKRQVLSPSFG